MVRAQCLAITSKNYLHAHVMNAEDAAFDLDMSGRES